MFLKFLVAFGAVSQGARAKTDLGQELIRTPCVCGSLMLGEMKKDQNSANLKSNDDGRWLTMPHVDWSVFDVCWPNGLFACEDSGGNHPDPQIRCLGQFLLIII